MALNIVAPVRPTFTMGIRQRRQRIGRRFAAHKFARLDLDILAQGNTRFEIIHLLISKVQGLLPEAIT